VWQKLWLAVALFGLFLVLGTIGYVFIEGWAPFEAFYMTIITLSTVGFGEIRDLSPLGRLFTSFLILGGIGSACYLFSLLTEAVISGQLAQALGERKNRKALEGLDNHYIVCGYGKVGRRICEFLRAEGRPFAVIDADETYLEELREEKIPYVIGDAISRQNLEALKIKKAKGLFATLGDSSKNLYLCLLAKELNPKIRLVARSEDEEAALVFEGSKIDALVQPSKVGALRMFLAMMRPHVVDLIEETMVDRVDLRDEILIEDFHITTERSLKDLGLKIIDGVYAVLIKRREGHRDFALKADDKIFPGDVLVVIGHEKDLQDLAGRIREDRTS